MRGLSKESMMSYLVIVLSVLFMYEDTLSGIAYASPPNPTSHQTTTFIVVNRYYCPPLE